MDFETARVRPVLGHGSAAFTLTVYGHLFADDMDALAATLDGDETWSVWKNISKPDTLYSHGDSPIPLGDFLHVLNVLTADDEVRLAVLPRLDYPRDRSEGSSRTWAMMADQDTHGRLEVAMARADELGAMYRSLVEQIPAITYTEALDTRETLSISPQVEILFGYTQEEWMADSLLCDRLIHPDDLDRVHAACDIANITGESYQQEYRMIARDGRQLWIRDDATVVSGSQGQPLCWQGVMLDITAQKEAEEASRSD